MNKDTLDVAVMEAQRFLVAAKRARKVLQKDGSLARYGSEETDSLRRRSRNLFLALADLGKPYRP